ncbi:MAG: flavin reductase family protein [Candidatus Sericytochromatia bacterium]|nr:flavin reductase family protein [Candidatus Tanganyikabacteria bacterium]
MTAAIAFDPADLSSRERYKILIGAIVPRPIAWVSTVSPAGLPNLAPFSFFNGVCSDPMAVSIAVGRRQTGLKDTLRNIEATGEFVINVVTEDLAEPMNRTSEEFPPEVDEFAVAGLTPLPGVKVAPPRVAESPINLECRLLQVVYLGDRPGSGSLVVGEVVYGHIRADLVDSWRIDAAKLRPIGRLGGAFYTRAATDVFKLLRPAGSGDG